ncbi:translation initiation factor IF-3 [Paenibacillus tuaregi]|uniref:translation initiation factor IF-3 n=1 Tax=Paenibacillus tuaregi TaxID=1816681 RepID=UPI000837D134|nr:translation initiation factor IF-3 [Paenibacillus tuaregi]
MILNEKIKAAEVRLTGLDGEDLGIVAASEALAMAKRLKVDLVCDSLMSSPPPCRLVSAGNARKEADQKRKSSQPPKLKEIRLTPRIEDHDYETKKQQAERMLKAGDVVRLVVKISGKEGAQAKSLLEDLVRDLKPVARPKSGIHVSGKQAEVQLDPL